MERKIIIVDSASNKQTTITTDAEKFGDLKAAARAAGITIEGKDWLEGLTKTQPVSDDSVLPTNVNYKGQITNNLVYMLTNTNKRTKSGAMSRAEAYFFIKSHNLASEVKVAFGKNYTNCTTDQLVKFANDNMALKPAEKAPIQEASSQEPAVKKCACGSCDALVTLVATFLHSIESNEEVTAKIQETYNKLFAQPKTPVEFSSADIQDMFRGINA